MFFLPLRGWSLLIFSDQTEGLAGTIAPISSLVAWLDAERVRYRSQPSMITCRCYGVIVLFSFNFSAFLIFSTAINLQFDIQIICFQAFLVNMNFKAVRNKLFLFNNMFFCDVEHESEVSFRRLDLVFEL